MGHDHAHGTTIGNPNELDIVVHAGETRSSESDLATARNAAAHGLRRLGIPHRRKATPSRPAPRSTGLLLAGGNGKYRLKLDAPGFYLVFESCGHDPLHHPHHGRRPRKPGWQHDYHAAHDAPHKIAVRAAIDTPGDLDGKKLQRLDRRAASAPRAATSTG
jgi:hypothetical protein